MDTNDLPLEVREVPEGEDLRQWHALIGTDLVLIKRPTASLAKLDVNSIRLPLPKHCRSE